jgi:hypothetical protein
MNYFIRSTTLRSAFPSTSINGRLPQRLGYIADPQQNPYLYGRVLAPDDMRYAMAVAMLYEGADPSKPTPKDIEAAKKPTDCERQTPRTALRLLSGKCTTRF